MRAYRPFALYRYTNAHGAIRNTAQRIVTSYAAGSKPCFPCAASGPVGRGAGPLPTYDGRMRRGFYFVLMVVLVLRGLAGTAMAAGALPPLPAGAPLVQGHSHHPAFNSAPAGAEAAPALHSEAVAPLPDAQAHGGHPGTQAATAAPLSDQGSPGVGDHTHPHAAQATPPACDGSAASCAAHEHHAAACSACDICHSAMLHVPAALAPAAGATGSALPMGSAQFDSAPAALAIKPPIA